MSKKVKATILATGEETIFNADSPELYKFIREAGEAGVDIEIEDVEDNEKDWEDFTKPLKELHIKGFTLNETTSNEMGGVYYDREGDDDCWVELNKACNADVIVVSYIYKSATIRVTVFEFGEADIESLSDFVIGYLPEEMK